MSLDLRAVQQFTNAKMFRMQLFALLIKEFLINSNSSIFAGKSIDTASVAHKLLGRIEINFW